MKFCWITIRVKDLEESLRFYQEIVGLQVERRFQARPGVEIAFLSGDGETKVEMICDANKQDVDLGQDISLGFEVESLEEKMKFVQQKGLSIHSGPIQPNPRIKFFFILDPNGLRIQFVENI